MTNKEKNWDTKKDVQKELEKGAKEMDSRKYTLRLYVSGITPRSTLAIENIRKICQQYLEGRYDLEVVDIFQQPEEAKKEQIIAAPTLIKKLPLPLRKFIGDLSDTERILVGLEIKEKNQV
jgi:circadian clock protein KaiB